MSEQAKLLADLARAKAMFQQRAILIYMGSDQPAPPAAMKDGCTARLEAQRAHDAGRRG